MFTKILASLVVVAALGIGGYTMYSNHACTGCPFSSAKSGGDCCSTQDDCCETASSCCSEGKLAKSPAADCCVPASDCCETGGDCCLKAGLSKEATAVSALVGVPASLKAAK